MQSNHHSLPGVRQLPPLTQGKLSRLCGLYSMLNGIQLALYPDRMSADDLQRLYLFAIDHLSRSRELKRVLGVGMAENTWVSLGTALVGRTNDQRGTALKLEHALDPAAPIDRSQVLREITARVRGGSPVLLGVVGALDHYTVVAGCSDHRLTFFDSSGLSWVAMESVGLVGDTRRHRTWSTGVLSIIDDW